MLSLRTSECIPNYCPRRWRIPFNPFPPLPSVFILLSDSFGEVPQSVSRDESECDPGDRGEDVRIAAHGEAGIGEDGDHGADRHSHDEPEGPGPVILQAGLHGFREQEDRDHGSDEHGDEIAEVEVGYGIEERVVESDGDQYGGSADPGEHLREGEHGSTRTIAGMDGSTLPSPLNTKSATMMTSPMAKVVHHVFPAGSVRPSMDFRSGIWQRMSMAKKNIAGILQLSIT